MGYLKLILLSLLQFTRSGEACSYDIWYNTLQQRDFKPVRGCGLSFGRLCGECDENAVDSIYGGNILHWSAGFGKPGEVEVLIAKEGFDMNKQDSYGHTPLHYAAYADRVDLARALVKWGANPKLKAWKGVAKDKTPLDFCRSRQQSWCQVLGYDGLEASYKTVTSDEKLTEKELTCISPVNCPSFSQAHLQELGAIMKQKENYDSCQFYNVTCVENQCAIGYTWNSFTCIQNCERYSSTRYFPACPASCNLSCPCGCQLTKDGVSAGQPLTLVSPLAATGVIQSVLQRTSCPTLQPCRRKNKCCRVAFSRFGKIIGCPSRC